MNEKHKILLVEDDDIFRETIREILVCEGYDVQEAENGKIAKELVKRNVYSVVISDIQMPEMTGVELVHWVRQIYDRSFEKNKPLPIILITGFSHIVETQKTHNMGVQEFLTKPFSGAELISGIKRTIDLENSETCANDDEAGRSKTEDSVDLEKPSFCKVSLVDFVSDKEIAMDVYVKLSKEKYIKIANKGGKIDYDRVESYKKKGLKYLYVRQQDFKKVLDFNVMLSKVVVSTNEVSPEKKRRFVANTAEIILENVMSVGIDKHAFTESKDFFFSCFDVLTDDPETFDLLKLLSGHTDKLYAHSLGVSIYSVMIAKEMGWKSTSTLFKLQFGALMHDVGKKEYPQELLEKPRSLLSYTEKRKIENHCFRGKEVLESLKSAPAEVVAIAYEHHENVLGQGYPRQLEKSKIHPMARIVSVANEFCKYALKDPENPNLTLQKAFHLLETYKKDELDPEPFEALKRLIRKGH